MKTYSYCLGVALTRRNFIAQAAALSLLPTRAWSAVETPILKFGVMTDTHIDERASSVARVRGAFDIFKREGVDVIGHCGDLADWHWDKAYQHYRGVIESTYPDRTTRPELLYVYANHDALNPKARDPNDHATRLFDIKTAMGWMREKLAIEHDFYCEKTIHGIPFIVAPQSWDIVTGGSKFIQERIKAVCEAHPKGPVVLMTHITPANTAYNSVQWGSGWKTALFSKYPQLITFTGHTHGSLRNELAIWQGAFTAVDVCCLQTWGGSCIGSTPSRKQAYDVLVVEFYPNRLILKRFDTRDGGEYAPERRWCVPLPFVAATAPYRPLERKKTERAVSFSANAAITVTTGKPPFDAVKIAFPAATDEDNVFKYGICLAHKGKNGWEDFTRAEVFSEFYQRPADRTGRFAHAFSSMNFPEGEPIRVRVVPIGFFGTEGTPIECVWTAHGSVQAVSTWVSENPTEEFPVVHHWWPRNAKEYFDAKPVPKPTDGWYDCVGPYYWMTLPDKLFDAPKGTHYRLAVDLRAKQDPYGDGMTLSFSGSRGGQMTAPGDIGLMRYIFDITIGDKPIPRRVAVSRGKAKIRFERFTLERLTP